MSRTAANIDINIRGSSGGLDKAVRGATKSIGALNTATAGAAVSMAAKFRVMQNSLGDDMRVLSRIALRGSSSFLTLGRASLSAAKNLRYIYIATKLVAKGLAAVVKRAARVTIAVAKLAGRAVLGVAAVTVAAIGATVAAGMRAGEGVDNLGKSSDKIGMTTEALAGFRHAASLADVSSEGLDRALVKMQRNLSEAAIGSGSAAGALEDLGLDAEMLKNAGPEEAFKKIADAINKIPNAADKTAIAMDIFGKSGAEMLALIGEGSEGLSERIKEAGELGLATTREQARGVEEANDAITTMKSAFSGLFRTVAIAIAPAVKASADGITSLMKWVNSFRDVILDAFKYVSFVIDNFGKILDLATDYIALKLVETANDVENFFTVVIPTAFWEAVSLAPKAFDNLTDQIAYYMVKITNIITHYAMEVIPEVFRNMKDIISGAFFGDNSAWDKAMANISAKMKREEGGIERILREDSERSGRILDRSMDASAAKISKAFVRGKGQVESALEQTFEKNASRLRANFADAMAGKAGGGVKAIKVKSAAGADADELSRSKGKDHMENHIITKGSQEALKIISGRNNDKTLKKMDDQLKETKKTNAILKLLATPTVKEARL